MFLIWLLGMLGMTHQTLYFISAVCQTTGLRLACAIFWFLFWSESAGTFFCGIGQVWASVDPFATQGMQLFTPSETSDTSPAPVTELRNELTVCLHHSTESAPTRTSACGTRGIQSPG